MTPETHLDGILELEEAACITNKLYDIIGPIKKSAAGQMCKNI
jgi:hypothetical protein